MYVENHLNKICDLYHPLGFDFIYLKFKKSLAGRLNLRPLSKINKDEARLVCNWPKSYLQPRIVKYHKKYVTTAFLSRLP